MFGKLIASENDEGKIEQGEQSGSENAYAANDLREHMVGILFSRSGKLTHLQKQVITLYIIIKKICLE